ncbi:MAG: hypothetical protein AAGJ83_16360, partial [Planctomycetota bacterium]
MNSYVDYRAPREHGRSLVQPSLHDAPRLLHANKELFRRVPAWLASLRVIARSQLIDAAVRYTRSYREIGELNPESPLLVAGHQPTLFHPGVWFKNVILDHLAKRTTATAINLIVDGDLTGPRSIQVPTYGDPPAGEKSTRLHRETVALDRGGSAVPFEQATIEDFDFFLTFGDRVQASLGNLIPNPSIHPLWQAAQDAFQRHNNLGLVLAQARHRLEAEMGMETLEVPQSTVCETDAFIQFALQILIDLPRFRECYNCETETYRVSHGIRSLAHPVPNLREEGGWHEAPFWIYGDHLPNRRGLWTRRVAEGLELTDRNQIRLVIPATLEAGAEALRHYFSSEFKLRGRALITTMFARLVISDLFIHGIGGGKYDQLGDQISRAFWSLGEMPEFLVSSATVKLPGHEAFDELQIERQLRAARK